MTELDEGLKNELLDLIKQGKPLPAVYKNLLFPPEKTPVEYELVYGIKEREEDILADTMSVPFQAMKQFGKVTENEWHNQLIFGDNLQALKHIKKLQDEGKLGKIKLVYIDPPFATKQEFQNKIGAKAYGDIIVGAEFIEFLRKRLILLRDILASDGSIYVHLDQKKSHYIKVILDEVFGEHNFKNEIIWQRADPHNNAIKKYGIIHDSIYYYSFENSQFNWADITVPLSKAALKEYSWMQLPNGKIVKKTKPIPSGARILKLNDATLKGNNPNRQFEWRGVKLKPNMQWLGTYTEMEEKLKGKELFLPQYPKGAKRCRVSYLDERLEVGQVIQDIWQDVGRMKGGKGVYPTQKPEKLLARIIKASSNEEDIILDCFSGSGTAGTVAEKLKRKWIMIDSSKLAIYSTIHRLFHMKREVGNSGKPLKPKPFVLYNTGLYEDHETILKMGEDNYQKFALECFQVEPKETEINGLKVDGVLFNSPVKVFSQGGFLTEEYVDELHETVGQSIKNKMFIIAPASRVYFLQDYIEKEGIRYYVLRIPYSIIDELHKKSFCRLVQPTSIEDVNQNIDTIGFDFIHPPNVKSEYYCFKPKDKLIENEFVIEIKDFETIQRSKTPIEFENPFDGLSMVFIDRDYNDDYFNMTDYYFAEDLKKQNHKIKFSGEVGEKIMIIYLDVLGNERIEVKNKSDFKRR